MPGLATARVHERTRSPRREGFGHRVANWPPRAGSHQHLPAVPLRPRPSDSRGPAKYLSARYYDPSTGQFLTRDPLVMATRSAYAYVNGGPLSGRDPSGLSSCDDWSDPLGAAVDCVSKAVPKPVKDGAKKVAQVGGEVARGAIDIVAVVPYGAYYSAYYALKGINSLPEPLRTVARSIPTPAGGMPLAQLLEMAEAAGLGDDIVIDWVKGEDWADESGCPSDTRFINPLHSFLPPYLRGPKVYLPGVHRDGNGNAHADFEW